MRLYNLSGLVETHCMRLGSFLLQLSSLSGEDLLFHPPSCPLPGNLRSTDYDIFSVCDTYTPCIPDIYTVNTASYPVGCPDGNDTGRKDCMAETYYT